MDMKKPTHTLQYGNITLHSSGQLWSNVKLRDSEDGIAAMLVNPNFLDLLRMSVQFSVHKIKEENKGLLNENEISQSRFEITQSMLQNIDQGLHAPDTNPLDTIETAVNDGINLNVIIPDVETLFVSKCITLTDRVTYRDLYDLWWITHKSGGQATTQSIFDVIRQYRPNMQYEHVRHRLLDWKIASTDESFDTLISDDITIEDIRSAFRREVNRLEAAMANGLKRQLSDSFLSP